MNLHPKTEQLLGKMGSDLKTWRVVQGLTASRVADRAGITRTTLRDIENQPGSVRLENFLAVLAVLGLDETVAAAIDPTQSIRGQTLLTAAVRKDLAR